MSEGGIEDAVVKNPVALWSASNDDEEEEDEEEHLAISGTKPLESNGVLTPYLDNENNALQLFQRTSDANQVIGDVNIESSNNVHIGHVFKTIVQGDIQNSSPVNQETNGYCKKATLAAPAFDDLKPSIALLSTILFVLSVTTVLAVLRFTTTQEVTEFSADDASNATSTERTRHAYIFRLQDWGGRTHTGTELIKGPVVLVIVKHTDTEPCWDIPSCFSSMQRLQGVDVGEKHEPTIAYNFVIGGSGDVYEGKGWVMSKDPMNRSIDVAFMGNFDVEEPTENMLEAGKYLIQVGVASNHLDRHSLRVVAHNQTEPTNSPGKNVFKRLPSWPFYSDDILYSRADPGHS
ncbi:hypothetical protein GWI33_018336 [Rhynchophorus ferrugineus]|uniref:Uncharacterized protein n=1 Tax=Rhynchophorus ferrugineus TaxID=354439 RepID=A0A834M2Q2_RHYFE|nr:hypothetical protein GWI33_018336 [Rhynchophorus ferrugineus]